MRLQACVLGFVFGALYKWTTDIESTEDPTSAIMRGLSGYRFASIVH